MMNRLLAALAASTLLCTAALAQDKPAAPAKPAHGKSEQTAKPADAKPEAAVQDAKADAKPAAAQDSPAAKAACPVCDKPVDMSKYARDRGQRTYFCCDDCTGKYTQDKKAYRDGVKKQRAALPVYRTQIACPVTGDKPNYQFATAEKHYDIYFASEEAKTKYDADPKAYAAKLPGAFTWQTACVLMRNSPIDPALFAEEGGKKYYFCCEKCQGGFAKDKAATIAKIEAQAKANEEAYNKMRAAAGGK